MLDLVFPHDSFTNFNAINAGQLLLVVREHVMVEIQWRDLVIYVYTKDEDVAVFLQSKTKVRLTNPENYSG